jgi:hypothetical protein
LVVTNGNVTLSGGSSTTLNDNATVNIGANASLTNLNPINGALFTLTKIGNGLLYFNIAPSIAANAGTTIDSGSCQRVTVNTGGTFGGSGTAATVDVKSGAVLAPGNLGIGTFTVSDSLTNAGAIVLEISKSGVTLSSDRIVVNTNFVHTGTLTVTNVGPDALTAGDAFRLFATNYAAIASAPISLPTLGAGLGWTNNLGVDGTIAVVSVAGPSIPTAPTNLTFSASGGNLTLSWPSNYVGWILQSQTNLRSVGLTVATNTWFDMAGSDALTSTNLPVSPAQPTVFFRLRYP